jgi:NAD(P)-dependent dehydrogenase (short-subunit alcohol dehydrogenase family)
MRLEGKAGIVIGAGQSPGETVGTGRAAAILFAREGAKVMLADRDPDSTCETADIISDAGGVAECVAADWTKAADCEAVATVCVEMWGRIDFLQNNVGIGTDDADPLHLTEEGLDKIFAVNLKGCLLSSQAVVPVMRRQGFGSIVNISSIAAVSAAAPLTAYKISKAAINALSHALAIDNAAHGVRVNTIMPGLLDTPMAMDAWASNLNLPREHIRALRDSMVPLRAKMGSGWDVAYASLFLHSDEAQFITGVVLPVDGGQLTRVGFSF